MQINLSGHHVELTDALRDYVTGKFERIERHYERINSVQVILNVEKLKHIAEAKLNVSGGELFANAEDTNMYAAIDVLVDKLDRQLLKHKEKQNSK